MINKEQLDYFILKEASKVLSEDLQSNILDINDEFNEKEESAAKNIEDTNKNIDTGMKRQIFYENNTKYDIERLQQIKDIKMREIFNEWGEPISKEDKKSYNFWNL